MSTEVSVTICGCRGSYPVSGEDFVTYGGATSCVVVRAGDREIIFDAGSGIINYGRQLLRGALSRGEAVTTSIFFSHSHFDHMVGLPYFAPIFHPASTIYLFGPRTSRFDSFEATVENLIRPPFYPVALHEMQAEKIFADMGAADTVYFLTDQDEPIKVKAAHAKDAHLIPDAADIEVKVSCMRGYNHPKSGISIYRIDAGDKSVVYATDTEGYVHGDQRLAEFSRDADLLIHDAMYTEAHYTSMPVPTQGYGHSTVKIAANLASLAKVGKLCLFHHDPASTDESLHQVGEDAREYFADTVVARDGLVIDL